MTIVKPDHIWAFDLGKASIGEAVRKGTKFEHKASLLIPAELGRRGPAAQSGTPANKYRAMKVREAHRERERWLETVWSAVRFTPLKARETKYVDFEVRRKKKKIHGKIRWRNKKVGGRWIVHKADYRLEREFAPRPGEKTKDGAPSDEAGANLCYTSCLLRIQLLRWTPGDPPLADWQVFKALRSALQSRGYGRVPWATKEALKQGKSSDELEKEEEKKLQQADARYREAVGKWPEFKRGLKEKDLPQLQGLQPSGIERKRAALPDDYYFVPPCYYDALHMGLWNPAEPDKLLPRCDHRAGSTRNVRFDRADVRREITLLGDQASAMLPQLRDAFARWQRDGWKFKHPFTGAELAYPVHAKTFGEFLCDGPAGKPDETSFEVFLNQRRTAGIRIGTFEEWMAGLGQKTPKFDNRILNDCVLFPRYHVCKVDVRLETDEQGKFTGRIIPESLLATEFTLLLKLKNLLVAEAARGQRKLTVDEVRDIFAFAQRRLKALPLLTPEGELIKEWPKKVAARFAINESTWKDIAAESGFFQRMKTHTVRETGQDRPLSTEETYLLLRAATARKQDGVIELPEHLAPLLKAAKAEWKKAKTAADDTMLRPMPGHEEVKAPRASGRSAYSRVALRILKELILSGDAPSAFHSRLLRREPDLLARLGPSPGKSLMILPDSTAADAFSRQREDTENRKRGALVSELNFLRQMRKDDATEDSWENLFVPSQTIEALQQRHTKDGELDADAAVRELLGTINDPVVRHRLSVFNERLKKLQSGDTKEGLPAFGIPDAIVLEFVREDFMGEEAKRELKDFQNKREAARKAAQEEIGNSGAIAQRYELCMAQGCLCLYCGQPFSRAKLSEYAVDHIVPVGLQGPDAMVNKVLAHNDCNEAKGRQTPFQWWHNNKSNRAPTISWDGYVQLVEKHAVTLRNKKVQLLTREDAPELVERYTALAETAWVSKLAQAIVNLRFGWKNGVDYGGPKPVKRVTVVSGGVTARVRRKYSLDKLLYGENTAPEVLAKKVKNREDKRHHALDAMVMTFIPQWARDPNKEGFFRFPGEFRDASGREDYQRIRALFQQHIDQVMPRNIAYEQPALADTSFGSRLDGARRIIVQRVSVFDLAQKPAGAPGKTQFDLEYLHKQIQAVRDPSIRHRLEEFAGTNLNEAQWRAFCESFAQIRKDGTTGARIIKVWAYTGQADQFKDLSKDGKGAWRKRKQDHRGQIVIAQSDGDFSVLPVYAFESPWQKANSLQSGPHTSGKVLGFFQSGCLVKVDREAEHRTKPLPPGIYKLRTIREDGYVQLEDQRGRTYPEWPLYKLSNLVTAGFRRWD